MDSTQSQLNLKQLLPLVPTLLSCFSLLSIVLRSTKVFQMLGQDLSHSQLNDITYNFLLVLTFMSCFSLLLIVWRSTKVFQMLGQDLSHSQLNDTTYNFLLVLTFMSCFSLLLALLRSMEVFLMSPFIKFLRCTSCSICRASPRLCDTQNKQPH